MEVLPRISRFARGAQRILGEGLPDLGVRFGRERGAKLDFGVGILGAERVRLRADLGGHRIAFEQTDRVQPLALLRSPGFAAFEGSS